MRTLPLSLVAVLAAQVAAGSWEPVSAQEQPGDTVRAAVLEDWPPHYQVRAGGEPTGFAVDVMEAVAERTGLTVQVVLFSTFPEAIDALASGRVDVVPNLGIIPSRADDFAFTRPFEAFRISVFTRSSDPDIAVPADVGAKRVGVVRSNAAVDLIREELPEAELVVFNDVREALFELLATGVDAVAYPEEVFLAHARSAGMGERVRALPGPLAEISRGMGVRASDTVLLARLGQGVDALVGSTEYGEIYQRWFGPPESFWTPGRVLLLSGGVLVLILLGMGVWRRRSVAKLAERLSRSLASRAQAEAARRQEEHRFQTLVEAAYEGIVLSDEEGRISFVNRRACQLLGVAEEDLLGAPFHRFVAREHHERIRESARRRREGVSESYEVRLRRPDGREVWALVSMAPLPDGSGALRGSIGTLADITDRIQADAELEETTRLLRKTLESVDGAVLVVDPGSRTIVECNQAAVEIFGHAREDLLGSHTRLLHVDDGHFREFGRRSEAVLKTGKPFRGEFTMRRADGSSFPSRHVVALLDPEEGPAAGVVSVVRDISEQRRARTELRESEARFRQIAERINDVFWITSPGKESMEYVSPAYRDIWGRPPEHLYRDATRWIEDIHPDDRQRVIDALPEQKAGTYEEQYRIVRPDGEVRWIWDRAFPVRDADGQVFRIVGVAEDITARVETDQELRERERRYRAFVENASDLISTFDRGGRSMYQSPAVKRLLGYEPDELRGQSVFDLIPSEGRPEAHEVWEELVTEPGTTVQVPAFRIRHRNGSWRTFEATLTNLLDDPAVGAVLSNARDVTEREELERRLRQSQKLEAVGRLAGGVAHDFNNLLTVIRANTEFLADDDALAIPLHPHVEEIRQAGIQGADLTRQLLAFSRDQVLDARPTQLNDVVAAVERLLRRIIGEDIRLDVNLAGTLPPVEIDPSQLEQVIMNLAVNAREAMPDGGKLGIVTTNMTLHEEEAMKVGLASAGPHVRLAVRDTGIGMDEETRERIFEPFFTTKSHESGTGLGLATVHGIVHQSGGGLEVQSEVGVGTTFSLYFPATEKAVDRTTEELPSVPDSLEGDAAILIVEDDTSVQRVLQRTLVRYGYNVSSAGSVERAKAVLADSSHAFDLILTDLVLPDASGIDFMEHVRSAFPDARLIAMSGYSRHETLEERVLAQDIPFLAKPFTPADVATLVRNVLSPESAG